MAKIHYFVDVILFCNTDMIKDNSKALYEYDNR